MKFPIFQFLVINLAIAVFGCSPGGHQARQDPLDAVAAAGVEQGFPAFVVSLSMPDSDAVIATAGTADLESGVPVTRDDGFHIASVTKAVTAVAVLKLVDDGRLGLADRLPDLLPASLIAAIPFSERMTIEQLLTHRSGLYSPNNDPDYWAPLIGPGASAPRFWSSEEIVAFAYGERNDPLFEPGQSQAYGDINYVLLSLIVEAVSGTPYKEFVAREVFGPLEMTRTYFLSDLAKNEPPPHPRVKAYTLVSDLIVDAFAFSDSFPRVAGDLAETSAGQERSDGAAGIISTAGDLDRFFRAVFDGELLSEHSTAFMLDAGNRAAPNAETLGVLRTYEAPYGTIVTAEGDGPGTNVVVAYRLSDGAVVVALTNLFGRFDESDFILKSAIPAAFESAGG